MPTPTPKIRRETVWPVVLAATITICSGYPAAVPEMGWFEPDKIGHFAAYGALATAIIRHPALARPPSPSGLWRTGWLAVLLASAYGLGDEFRQSLNYYRSYDLADWTADTLGAAVAVTLYLRWTPYRRLLERSVFVRRKALNKEVTSNKDQVPGGLEQVPSDK